MAVENIDVLNTALDLNLVNVDREQAAGSFSIDLVAEDEGGGTVVIENQLEKSNDDHLGKLITYPSTSSLFRSFLDLTTLEVLFSEPSFSDSHNLLETGRKLARRRAKRLPFL